MENYVKIQDFARENGVTDRQIQRQLKKYELELVGHYERRGSNGTWLDEKAQEFLREKMKKQPIVVADSSIQQELDRLRQENNMLKDRLLSTQDKLLMAQELFVEGKTAQALLTASQEDLKFKNKILKEKEEALAHAEEKIQKLKSRNLFERISKKYEEDQ